MDEVRRLLGLALPVIVGQLGMMMMGLVDVWTVGQIGGRELAGVALANALSFSAIVVGIGAAFGLDPLVAQAVGARDDEGRERALASGIVMLGLLSVPIIGVHLAMGPILRLLHQPEDLLDTATAYGLAVAPSAPAMVLFIFFRQAMQARGIVKPFAWIVLGANVVNVGGNVLFIYGWGPVPAMGAVGSGVATTLVRWAMLAAVVAAAAPERQALRAGLARGVSASATWAVTLTALPVGFQVGLEVWAFNAALPMMGWFGEASLAAHTVALSLAGLAFQVPMGLGSAAAARVGNLIGEGRRWERAGWTAVGMGGAWGLVSAVLLVVVGIPLSGWFLPTDPVASVLAASLLPYAAAFQVFDATQVVLFGVLRGAGDTRLPSVANLVGYYVIGLPVGWALAVGAGWEGLGVWAGIVAGLAVVAVILAWRLWVIQARGVARLEV